MNIIENALNFLFPPVCGICIKKSKNWICENCLTEISPKLKIIKNKINNIEFKIYYLLYYKDIIRKRMIEFKFNDKSYMYKTFSNIILKNKNLCKILNGYDIIIPVPMSKNKKSSRGYNQTELIAKEISKNLRLDYNEKILIKQKDNKMQSMLSFKERRENVKDAFKVDEKYLKLVNNKKIILLDDIYTTGFTVKECIKELLKLRPKKIDVLVISKGKIERW